jgi:peptidoglycan hydrolase CwlO-like protein
VTIEQFASIVAIVGAILGVGWKLGQIATSIKLEIAELKGLLGSIQQSQNNTDSRVTRAESDVKELELRVRALEQDKR